MTKEKEKKGGILKVAIIALVVIYGAYVIGKNVIYRTSETQENARKASIDVVNEMESDTNELGFATAQKRIQERSQENIAKLDGLDKMVAVIGGFLGLENRFSEGYEVYCKSHGVSSMPNLKRNVSERNKDIHNKAVAVLQSAGINESDIETQIINPMKPQIQQVIDMELKSLASETGQTVKEICEALDATADNNPDLEIGNQRPDIIEIINGYEI